MKKETAEAIRVAGYWSNHLENANHFCATPVADFASAVMTALRLVAKEIDEKETNIS